MYTLNYSGLLEYLDRVVLLENDTYVERDTCVASLCLKYIIVVFNGQFVWDRPHL